MVMRSESMWQPILGGVWFGHPKYGSAGKSSGTSSGKGSPESGPGQPMGVTTTRSADRAASAQENTCDGEL